MHVRLASEDDAGAVRAIYAPIVEETVVSFEDDPPSESEMADRIADTLPEYPWLVCERIAEDGDAADRDTADRDDEDRNDEATEIAGYAYASHHRKRDAYRWSVDVSVYVAEDYRRKGVGRGLYESLLELLRSQGFYNAFAGIALPNDASVALHESLGFEQVGVYESVGYKHGAWRDVGWWQLELQNRPEDPDTVDSGTPEEPRTVTEVEGTGEFETALSVGEASVEP